MDVGEKIAPQEFYNPELDRMQDHCLEALANSRANGVEAGYVNIVMGGGKTRIIAKDVAAFLDEEPDAKVLYLCHDARILNQAMGEFNEQIDSSVHIGSILKGSLDHESQVTMASFQQLNREVMSGGQKLYELIPEDHYDYIVVDESHHGPAPTYRQVIEHFTPKFLRGLTGTPNRMDRQDISKIFGKELYFVSLEEAIAKGFVSGLDYRVFSEEMRHVNEEEGNVDGISFQEIVDKAFVKRDPAETVRIIEEQTADIEDRKLLVFCSSIEESELYAKLLGGRSAAIHSKLTDEKRDEIWEKFRLGEIDTLTAVDIVNEGADVPDINAVAFIRSTESQTIFLQQLGRGLRRATGKKAVRVLDFVANYDRVQYILALQERLQDANKAYPRESSDAIPFSFKFSENTKRVIRYLSHIRRRYNRNSGNAEAIEALLQTKLPENQRPGRYYERRLIRKMRAGDKAAKEQYILHRARTIYSAISRIPEMNGRTREDYFQAGCAVVIEHVMKSKNGRDDINSQEVYVKARQAAFAELRQNDMPPAKDSAIAVVDRKVAPEAIMTWQEAKQLGGYVEDPAMAVDELLFKEEVAELLDMLSDKERRVIELRYGINCEQETLDEVGRRFNVSRERIRQIENIALKKLQGSGFRKPELAGTTFITSEYPYERATARSLGYLALVRKPSLEYYNPDLTDEERQQQSALQEMVAGRTALRLSEALQIAADARFKRQETKK